MDTDNVPHWVIDLNNFDSCLYAIDFEITHMNTKMNVCFV